MREEIVWVDTYLKCEKCQQLGNVVYREYEDSECHVDIQYWCKNCQDKWWIDGIDS